jgi:hypothetical protein
MKPRSDNSAENDAAGKTKPGETKPGETKPGETKPGETKPGETDAGKADMEKRKDPDAGTCYRLKLTTRGREIIAHQQAISAHRPKNHPDRTVTGIVEKGLRTLEEGTAAASPLRYNLLEGAELVRILGVLDQSRVTLRQFRSDALHPDTISAIGPKYIAELVTKAEDALEAIIAQTATVTHMAYIVRNLSADDHRLLTAFIRIIEKQAADPKTTEETRSMLTLGVSLFKAFIEPPTSKPSR